MRLGSLIISVALLIAAVVGGCSLMTPDPTPISVVLITVDTLRSDRLGAYGYAQANTPSIDKLASEGALFENVYCDISWTTASMASMMTGLFNSEHGLQAPWMRLADSSLTMAEVFRSHRYKTGAVVGIFSLDAAYGLNKGFDFYDDDFSLPTMVLRDRAPTTHVDLKITDDVTENARLADQKMLNDAYKKDEVVTDSALAWLRSNKEEPFFLWAHYFGPHEIIGGKADDLRPIRERLIADYDRDVANTDIEVGRLLQGIDDLGLRANTLVVLSADHGQMLGEGIAVGHGRDLFEPDVRIPLLVRLPSGDDHGHGIPAGLSISQIVRSVDIFPTVLDYAGIPNPDHLVGRSVRDLIDGKEPTDRVAFMDLIVIMPDLMDDDDGNHFSGGIHLQAIRMGKWKFLKGNLRSPCWEGGDAIAWDGLKLNAIGREGSIRLPDEQCASNQFASLFDVSDGKADVETEARDEISKHPALANTMGAILAEMASAEGKAERFELTPEQEQRLKSLGYLR